MINSTRTYHVQVDIRHAADEVIVILDGRCVIPVFPECATTPFTSVVFLRRSTSDKLHCRRNFIVTEISNQ